MHPVPTMWRAIALGLGLTFAVPATAAEEAGAGQLEQRVRRLENIVDSDQLVRLIRRIDALSGEIRELRGSIEMQGHELSELRKRQRSLYGDLDRRLRELEVAGRQYRERQDEAQGGDDGEQSGDDQSGDGQSGDGQSGDDGAGGGASSGGSVAGPSAADAGTGADQTGEGDESRESESVGDQRAAYNAAFGLLKDGRYDAAAEAFSDFIEAHPRGPYADNAQYWLGEARYVTRDFEAALAAFRAITERYADSAKVPDARLKIGYTLYELQRYGEARTALQEVMAEHSGSTVARLAEERLLRLERRQARE